MASKKRFSSFLVFFFLLTFSVLTTVGETISNTKRGFNVEKMVQAISSAGYFSMSITLRMTLNTLIAPSVADRSADNDTKFTIFCPVDEAFFTSKYPQPPLTLVKYHIVPMKLDRESLEYSSSSLALPVHSKIDTLLPGHPLVLTSFTDQLGFSSINLVNITKWHLYKDEFVVVHGVENFFDPAYQTLLYPRYDKNDNNDNNSKSVGGGLLILVLKDGYIVIWMLAVFVLIGFIAYPFCVVFCGEEGCIQRRRRTRDDNEGVVSNNNSSDEEMRRPLMNLDPAPELHSRSFARKALASLGNIFVRPLNALLSSRTFLFRSFHTPALNLAATSAPAARSGYLEYVQLD